MNIRKPFSGMRRYISIVMSVYVLLLLSAAAFCPDHHLNREHSGNDHRSLGSGGQRRQGDHPQ